MAKKKVKEPFLYDYEEKYGDEWPNPDDLEAPWRVLDAIGAEKSFNLEKVYRDGNRSYHSRGVSMVRGTNGYAKITWYWGCGDISCDYMEVTVHIRNIRGCRATKTLYRDINCLDWFSEAVGEMFCMVEEAYDEIQTMVDDFLKQRAA